MPFTLLADKDHAIAEAYGSWQLKKMLGKEYMGVVRTTVIIDPEGKVARVFEKVTPSEHPAPSGKLWSIGFNRLCLSGILWVPF